MPIDWNDLNGSPLTGTSPKSHVAPRELINGGTPHQHHTTLNLRMHLAERALYSSLSGNGEWKQVIAAKAHCLGAQRQRLQHMRASLNSTVHHNIEFVTDRIDDLGQLIEAAARSIELAPTVVRQHNAGATDVYSTPCVFYRHDTFEADAPRKTLARGNQLNTPRFFA